MGDAHQIESEEAVGKKCRPIACTEHDQAVASTGIADDKDIPVVACVENGAANDGNEHPDVDQEDHVFDRRYLKTPLQGIEPREDEIPTDHVEDSNAEPQEAVDDHKACEEAARIQEEE